MIIMVIMMKFEGEALLDGWVTRHSIVCGVGWEFGAAFWIRVIEFIPVL
jgi:hypothetical protein